MRRNRATTIVVALIAVVVGAAVVDTLRGGASRIDAARAHVQATTDERTFVRTALPPCRPEQVQLTISAYGPRPIAFLRHVNGPSCDLGFLHVRLSARGPDGQDPLADVEIPPGGDVLEGALARGGELAIETPTYEALCARTRDRGVPFRVRVRIGLYRAQRIITCP